MQILLPPSETKRVGGTGVFDPLSLGAGEQLGATRERVRSALEAVSATEEAAAKALKLGVKNREERLYNLALGESGSMPALERYTGVLYDALDYGSLGDESRAWAAEHVHIQSALFGLIGGGERIPAYRLSGSSRLPELGAPLHRSWASAHANLLSGASYVLDMRSKDYAALAPLAALGAENYDFVEVVARSEDGEVRALNHFNKAAKGDLVRRLATDAPIITNRADLLAWAASNACEFTLTDDPHTIRLVTQQGVPSATR